MNSATKIVSNSFLRNWGKGVLCLNANLTRNLYSQASMGLDTYITVREKTRVQFANGEDKFKLKMAEFSAENSKHMIFTEDLKSMVHLVENKEEDLDIVLAMMKKFNKQNKELRFGSFVFGPVIMRMYYHLGRPLEALAAFKDEELAGIFDQLITYQLLLDLLFVNEHYQEVLEVFEIVKSKQLQPNRYPKNVVVLFYAACYKLNTPEAYQLASVVWKDLKEVNHIPMRKATTFAAALALNQGNPHIALEILSNEKNQNYITVRNLKAWALADLGRPDDVVPLLRSVLNTDDAHTRKHTFTGDTMERVKVAMEKCEDKDTLAEYQRIEKQLVAHQLIVSENLSTFLCQEMSLSQNPRDNNSQRSQFLAGSYNRRPAAGMGGGTRYRQRPGLADML